MKKILIVDDTPENLDAAKNFFATIPGYEFIYATNRKDAEKHLEEATAVITDNHLPSNSNVVFLDCDVDDRDKDTLPVMIGANGAFLFYKAHLSGKPVVMLAEYAYLSIYLPNVTKPTPKQYIGDAKDFSLEGLIATISEKPTYTAYQSLWRYCNFGGKKTTRYEDARKTHPRAWQMAWEELSKQF